MDFSRGKDFLEVPTQIDRPQPGKTHFIAPPTLSLSHFHSLFSLHAVSQRADTVV
jgi:hypothetical protein